jgi:hypothetical protein
MGNKPKFKVGDKLIRHDWNTPPNYFHELKPPNYFNDLKLTITGIINYNTYEYIYYNDPFYKKPLHAKFKSLEQVCVLDTELGRLLFINKE